MAKCLNCYHDVNGKFCSECGQKAATHRLTSHQIVHDLQHVFLHLDKGVLKNVQTIWKPQMIRDYISGKRVGFYNPVILLFLVAGVMVYIEHTFHLDIQVDNAPANNEKMHLFGFTLATFYVKYSKFFEVAIVLPLSWMCYLLFKKETGYNWVENLYIQAFIVCNMNMIGILAYPMLRLMGPLVSLNIITISLLIMFNFIIYAPEPKRLNHFFRAMMVVTGSYVLYILFFVTGILLYMKIKGML